MQEVCTLWLASSLNLLVTVVQMPFLSGISSAPELGLPEDRSSTFSCRKLPSELQNGLSIPLQCCNEAGTA